MRRTKGDFRICLVLHKGLNYFGFNEHINIGINKIEC